jgi:hypothetical protein
VFVNDEFGPFYKAMFAEQVRREDMRAVFLEYAWNMNWCDPCAADPLSTEELRDLGVFWLSDDIQDGGRRPLGQPGVIRPRPVPMPRAVNVFVTRLHVRYDNAHFPEDLLFQQTGDESTFQGRYVLRHPWEGSATCEAAARYREEVPKRLETQAQALASLTGWSIADIRKKMHFTKAADPQRGRSWWDRIWAH